MLSQDPMDTSPPARPRSALVPHGTERCHGQPGAKAGQDGGDDDHVAAALCGCGVNGVRAAGWKGTG